MPKNLSKIVSGIHVFLAVFCVGLCLTMYLLEIALAIPTEIPPKLCVCMMVLPVFCCIAMIVLRSCESTLASYP